MKVYNTSKEDYLKAIYRLDKETGSVRSVDVARYLGYSKPSVSHAVSLLTDEGYLEIGGDFILHLTEKGKEIAENIYERHCFFTKYLISIGVDPTLAEEDACRMEHAISEESFQKLKENLEVKC